MTTLLAIVAVGLASITDLMVHRIPNTLTVTVFLLGLCLQFFLSGWSGLLNGLAGALANGVVFFPFYLTRWTGAGDVKLLMAVGACLGWRLGLLAVLSTLLIGAIVAIWFLLIRGELFVYFGRYWRMAKCLVLTGQVLYLPPLAGEAATVRFPYAIAIGMGTLAAIYGPEQWPLMRIPILSGG